MGNTFLCNCIDRKEHDLLDSNMEPNLDFQNLSIDDDDQQIMRDLYNNK